MASIGRWAAGAVAVLVLAGAPGCTVPEAALRERPASRLELAVDIPGVSAEEVRELEDRLARGLALEVVGPDLPEGPHRVLRVALQGRPNPAEGLGLGATWAASAGGGALTGALVPLTAGGVGWPAVPWGAGLGLVVGLGSGPFVYRANQHQLASHGYLPWVFTATWEVLDRGSGPAQRLVARRNPAPLDLGPHLRPLPPEGRTAAGVRRACLQAYGDALVAHFRPGGPQDGAVSGGMLGPGRH